MYPFDTQSLYLTKPNQSSFYLYSIKSRSIWDDGDYDGMERYCNKNTSQGKLKVLEGSMKGIVSSKV